MYHFWHWTLSWCLLWLPYEICFAWNHCKGNTKCRYVRILLLRTDKDFYFQSQTVPKLYMHYFSYTGLYIYVQLAFSPAIYRLSTKNTLKEKTSKSYMSDKGEWINLQLISWIKSCGMETHHLWFIHLCNKGQVLYCSMLFTITVTVTCNIMEQTVDYSKM